MSIACSTCLDMLTPSDKATVTPCGHVFHAGCIKTWLRANVGRPTCPQCRAACPEGQLRTIFFACLQADEPADRKLATLAGELTLCETEKRASQAKIQELLEAELCRCETEKKAVQAKRDELEAEKKALQGERDKLSARLEYTSWSLQESLEDCRNARERNLQYMCESSANIREERDAHEAKMCEVNKEWQAEKAKNSQLSSDLYRSEEELKRVTRNNEATNRMLCRSKAAEKELRDERDALLAKLRCSEAENKELRDERDALLAKLRCSEAE